MRQNIYQVISDKRSVPFNTTSTGTASVTGRAIVGVGTLFKTELQAGSYVVLLSANECRKVVRTDSDTIAFLETPFSVNIGPGSPIQIINHWKTNPIEISLKIDDADPAGQLNGQSFDGILTLSKASRDRSARRDLVEPIVVDATGTSMKVNILY